MAFFEKKQYREFQRTDDGFIYKGTHHTLSEIQHLFFNRVVTTGNPPGIVGAQK